MSSETPLIFWKKPIRKGFPLSGRLTFGLKSGLFLLLDHDFLFAIKPNLSTDLTKVVPTFIVDGNTVVFTIAASVTSTMVAGLWVGFIGLTRISDGSLSHEVKFKILVEEVVIP